MSNGNTSSNVELTTPSDVREHISTEREKYKTARETLKGQMSLVGERLSEIPNVQKRTEAFTPRKTRAGRKKYRKELTTIKSQIEDSQKKLQSSEFEFEIEAKSALQSVADYEAQVKAAKKAEAFVDRGVPRSFIKDKQVLKYMEEIYDQRREAKKAYYDAVKRLENSLPSGEKLVMVDGIVTGIESPILQMSIPIANLDYYAKQIEEASIPAVQKLYKGIDIKVDPLTQKYLDTRMSIKPQELEYPSRPSPQTLAKLPEIPTTPPSFLDILRPVDMKISPDKTHLLSINPQTALTQQFVKPGIYMGMKALTPVEKTRQYIFGPSGEPDAGHRVVYDPTTGKRIEEMYPEYTSRYQRNFVEPFYTNPKRWFLGTLGKSPEEQSDTLLALSAPIVGIGGAVGGAGWWLAGEALDLGSGPTLGPGVRDGGLTPEEAKKYLSVGMKTYGGLKIMGLPRKPTFAEYGNVALLTGSKPISEGYEWLYSQYEPSTRIGRGAKAITFGALTPPQLYKPLLFEQMKHFVTAPGTTATQTLEFVKQKPEEFFGFMIGAGLSGRIYEAPEAILRRKRFVNSEKINIPGYGEVVLEKNVPGYGDVVWVKGKFAQSEKIAISEQISRLKGVKVNVFSQVSPTGIVTTFFPKRIGKGFEVTTGKPMRGFYEAPPFKFLEAEGFSGAGALSFYSELGGRRGLNVPTPKGLWDAIFKTPGRPVQYLRSIQKPIKMPRWIREGFESIEKGKSFSKLTKTKIKELLKRFKEEELINVDPADFWKREKAYSGQAKVDFINNINLKGQGKGRALDIYLAMLQYQKETGGQLIGGPELLSKIMPYGPEAQLLTGPGTRFFEKAAFDRRRARPEQTTTSKIMEFLTGVERKELVTRIDGQLVEIQPLRTVGRKIKDATKKAPPQQPKILSPIELLLNPVKEKILRINERRQRPRRTDPADYLVPVQREITRKPITQEPLKRYDKPKIDRQLQQRISTDILVEPRRPRDRAPRFDGRLRITPDRVRVRERPRPDRFREILRERPRDRPERPRPERPRDRPDRFRERLPRERPRDRRIPDRPRDRTPPPITPQFRDDRKKYQKQQAVKPIATKKLYTIKPTVYELIKYGKPILKKKKRITGLEAVRLR